MKDYSGVQWANTVLTGAFIAGRQDSVEGMPEEATLTPSASANQEEGDTSGDQEV